MDDCKYTADPQKKVVFYKKTYFSRPIYFLTSKNRATARFCSIYYHAYLDGSSRVGPAYGMQCHQTNQYNTTHYRY